MLDLTASEMITVEHSLLSLFLPFKVEPITNNSGSDNNNVQSQRLIPLVVTPTKNMERTPDQIMHRSDVPIKEWRHNRNALTCVVFKLEPPTADNKRNVVSVFDTNSIQGSYKDIDHEDNILLRKIHSHLKSNLTGFGQNEKLDNALENLIESFSQYIQNENKSKNELYSDVYDQLATLDEMSGTKELETLKTNMNNVTGHGYLKCFMALQTISKVRLLLKNVVQTHHLIGQVAHIAGLTTGSEQNTNETNLLCFEFHGTSNCNPGNDSVKSCIGTTFIHQNSEQQFRELLWTIRGSLLDDIAKLNTKKDNADNDQNNFIIDLEKENTEDNDTLVIDNKYLEKILLNIELPELYKEAERNCSLEVGETLQCYFHHLKGDHTAPSEFCAAANSAMIKLTENTKRDEETKMDKTQTSNEEGKSPAAASGNINPPDIAQPDDCSQKVDDNTTTNGSKRDNEKGEMVINMLQSFLVLEGSNPEHKELNKFQKWVNNNDYEQSQSVNITRADMSDNVLIAWSKKVHKKELASNIMKILNVSTQDENRFQNSDFDELSFFVRFCSAAQSRNNFSNLLNNYKAMGNGLTNHEMMKFCNTVYTASWVTIQHWFTKMDDRYDIILDKMKKGPTTTSPKNRKKITKKLLGKVTKQYMGLYLLRKLPIWIYNLLEKMDKLSELCAKHEFTVSLVGRNDNCDFKSLITDYIHARTTNDEASKPTTAVGALLCQMMVLFNLCNQATERENIECPLFHDITTHFEEKMLTGDDFLVNLFKLISEKCVITYGGREGTNEPHDQSTKQAVMNGYAVIQSKQLKQKQNKKEVLRGSGKKRKQKSGKAKARKAKKANATNTATSIKTIMTSEEFTIEFGNELEDGNKRKGSKREITFTVESITKRLNAFLNTRLMLAKGNIAIQINDDGDGVGGDENENENMDAEESEIDEGGDSPLTSIYSTYDGFN